jgi:hypothetical protein
MEQCTCWGRLPFDTACRHWVFYRWKYVHVEALWRLMPSVRPGLANVTLQDDRLIRKDAPECRICVYVYRKKDIELNWTTVIYKQR